jgi:branched-subunit amino acid ABC-type transport system permease component
MRVRDIWTLPRAIRLGLLAALAALLLWPVHAVSPEPVRPIFVAALAVAALCGTSILLMSVVDLLTVTRDRSVLPARVFDLLLGLGLTLPSVLALFDLLD